MNTKEIKFRIWEGKGKEDKIFDALGISWNDIVLIDKERDFTECKDKNNKEIFKGDIVQSTNDVAVINSVWKDILI